MVYQKFEPNKTNTAHELEIHILKSVSFLWIPTAVCTLSSVERVAELVGYTNYLVGLDGYVMCNMYTMDIA